MPVTLGELKDRIRESVLASDPRKMAREVMDQGVVIRWLIYAIAFLTFVVYLLIVSRNDRNYR